MLYLTFIEVGDIHYKGVYMPGLVTPIAVSIYIMAAKQPIRKIVGRLDYGNNHSILQSNVLNRIYIGQILIYE